MAKRVFFSFHYQDVIDFRANTVRQCWQMKPDRDAAGFFDASIWETAKATSDLSVKRLINAGLVGSSVTCVLVGSHTYARRWVRYEILSSYRKGNAIVAVHINSIKGKDGLTKTRGPNPLNYVGVSFSESGITVTLWEKINGKWQEYTDIDGSAAYQRATPVAPQYRGQGYNLAHFYREYDWVSNDGFNNFASWIG